jgi:signal transduction histidine kinase
MRRLIRDWSSEFAQQSLSVRQAAFVVAGAFAVLAITWVIVTDALVVAFTNDLMFAQKVHIAADWLFVLLTGAALFTLARSVGLRITQTQGVLQAVIRSMGDGLLVLGRDRTIIYANPAAVKMLECGDASQLVGMTAAEFSRHFLVSYPNGALVKPDALVSQRAFSESGALRYKAVLHPSPDDEVVILSSAAGVRESPDERATLVVSVMHDITADENLARLRDQFFSAAAHALKTPVAIIKANVQLMGSSTQRIPASALAVQRQCDRIDQIVQNLLIVSRARTHTLHLYPEQMELSPLLESTAHDLVTTNFAPGVETDVVGSPPIRGDRERLQLVVRNLAYEALIAARPKTPLTLRLVPREHDVELSVHFDPLPAAERTFSGAREQDDTTLARCATTTIVEAHGGATGEETMSEHEAMLWIRLPVMERAA